ncbi:MAG: 4-(cytidine 5'-diphospho)-2-C-methyl-D-erythritol kinase, partial [Pseudomonadota bacterium]
MQSIFCETARAKVNLTLQVLGRRAGDGYHRLASLIVFADIGDDVVLTPDDRWSVKVSGPTAGDIAGPNLAEMALLRAKARWPGLVGGHIEIETRLPVAAGIGGGSADAGAVLRLLRHANQDVGTDGEWLSLAGGLGADVPICFLNRAAWVCGIGDVIAPVRDVPSLHGVLVNPCADVPADKTRQVFSALAAPTVADDVAEPSCPDVAGGSIELVYAIRQCGNDLEQAAISVVPAMVDVLAAQRGHKACQ